MKKLGLLIFMGLLSGCSLLFPEPTIPLYTLKGGIFEQHPELSESLIIDLPKSEASLNTQRIAVTPSPYQRDYLAEGQWPDRLPKVFQEVLLDSFTQQWGGKYVNRSGASLQAKYILYSEIQDFSVYYLEKSSPEVRLRVTFKLINMRERQVFAGKTFFITMPVILTTVNGVVEAFNKGVRCLLVDVTSWMEKCF